MALGNWTPDNKQNLSLSTEIVQRYITLANSDQLENLSNSLSETEIEHQAGFMSQTVADWSAITDPLSDDEITSLIKFFTKAEQLPGWQAGDQSPVIGLGKILKKRGVGINKELSLWIKTHSDNRFLPHGSLL